MKKRVTYHNGRVGSGGKAINPKHHDRHFDVSKADHIDSALAKDNKVVRYVDDVDGADLNEYELNVYKQYFTEMHEAQKARYRAQRQYASYDKIADIDDYRKTKNKCPEESIIQVGSGADSVDADLLWQMYQEYADWHRATYPQIMLLDATLHVDEPDAAPHIHMRKIYTYTDDNDMLCIGQEKCLEQMGVVVNKPDKPIGKYNNRKVTYTEQCRHKMQELSKQYSIDLDIVPRKASESGLELRQYKMQKAEEKARKAEEWAKRADERTKAAEEREVDTRINIIVMQNELMQDILDQRAELADREQKLDKREQALDKRELSLNQRERIIDGREQLQSQLPIVADNSNSYQYQ